MRSLFASSLYFLNMFINKKRIFIGSVIFIAAVALVFCFYAPVIFQEGDPRPLLSGIWQLNFSRKDIVKLKVDGERYLTKSRNGREVIAGLMQSRGYEFAEQLGAGYFFKSKDGAGLVAVHRYYSRYYSLWNFSVTAKNGR
jgi:hypothetical protein